MPFYIRVSSLITPVHCITKTEEPHFLTDSNGDKIDNPRFLRKSEKRLKKAQRKLSKKKKGSQKRWFFVTWYGSIRGQKSAKSLSGKVLN
jgi:hypothetical protein